MERATALPRAREPMNCWCGSRDFTRYSDDYLECARCGTLASEKGVTQAELKVGEDESGFYGKEYWLSRMAEPGKGFPDIHARARTELIERNLYWLRTLISLKRPPGQILELGCAHGGFLALLVQCGYSATGIELSPWVCDFARKTFEVPVLCGPAEEQRLAPATFDVIVLMDVLEHLPDPVGTITTCAKLLKPDGLVLVQTPRHVHGRSFEELRRADHPFLKMLLPREHVYLFNENSAGALFKTVGLGELRFFPAIFDQYDMFFSASRLPLALSDTEEVEKDLLAGGRDQRLILGLLDLGRENAELAKGLRKSEEDRAARLEQIHTLKALLEESEADRAARLQQIHALAAQGGKRLRIRRAAPKAGKHIVVDMTPVLPGADNGGAKLMTLELVRHMAALAPDTQFTVLTLERSFKELAELDRTNVRRMLIAGGTAKDRLPVRLVRLLGALGGPRIQNGLERRARVLIGRAMRALAPSARLVGGLGGTALYCPFTAPFFAQKGIPTVSTVYDLQFADYPQFFDEADRAQRQLNFMEACRRAERLICISDFVKERVLRESGLRAERVSTIHIRMGQRLPAPDAATSAVLSTRLGLTPGRYLLYPANFWRHKNHEMLLVAMGIFYARYAGSDLKLVCTGAPGERRDFISMSAERMRLSGRVVLPGFLSEKEFSALMHQCSALIYPSLYEGFGMPVIEAQAIGRPVLCSNAGSLPEIAGDGALVFDPKLPEAIAGAIAKLDGDPLLREQLVEKGLHNASRFQDTGAMAAEYLAVFENVMKRTASQGGGTSG